MNRRRYQAASPQASFPVGRDSLLVCLLLFIATSLQAQIVNGDDATAGMPQLKVAKTLVDGDSIQYVEFSPLYIVPEPVFKTQRQRKAYDRMVHNVKKTLPIAKEVNQIIIETYEYIMTLPSDKERAAHLKRVEKDIKERYTPRMKKLTFQQGKLLIKLIHRECNSSSYQLIQAFLGPIKAGFYQAFAWAYGASLTKKYDPEGDDCLIEQIVRQIEAGQL